MPPVSLGIVLSAVIGVVSEANTGTPGSGGLWAVAGVISASSVLLGTLLTGATKMILVLRRPDRVPSTARGRAKARRDLERQLARLDDDLDEEG